ncbi:hypothetical protein ILUMI_08605 [Ignelater luminosus]|uniref:Pacifastin domain-containing protein n=1 Tax=Ignelater luminosus TaxID=2038154 RepID=A0A8K0GAH0_IGNLU|nr:hypothetical protein ILUMI_08605 [Ignelater luminosus]
MKVSTFLGIFLSFAALVLSINVTKFKCKKGVRYVENHCNECYCQENGMLRCNLIGCESHYDPILRNCPIGYMWTQDCERCWCVIYIGTLCTTECRRRFQ